jgi:hypothetical protein
MSLNEYQNYAEECLRWAAEARNERHRQIYFEMAKAWMLAARLAGPDRTATEDATASVYNFTAKHF